MGRTKSVIVQVMIFALIFLFPSYGVGENEQSSVFDASKGSECTSDPENLTKNEGYDFIESW